MPPRSHSHCHHPSIPILLLSLLFSHPHHCNPNPVVLVPLPTPRSRPRHPAAASGCFPEPQGRVWTSPAASMRCSRPKAVDNAHIDAGNSTQLHACLRYTCKPGYKRKAGTSGLIQCVLHDSKPVWTPASLQCIRKISVFTPFPQAGTTGAAPTSSPSPTATPAPPGAEGPSPETSTVPATSPLLETSPPGKGMALGTTPLPIAPADHAAGWFTSPRETTCQRGCVSLTAGSFTVLSLFPLPSELLFNAVSPSVFPFPGLPQLCG
uniref:Sushi domain-containing protein n=1 Tax=Anas zonorhyncha TaxID=75864 RepID=A0A8B9V5A9_9AVES